MGSSYELTPAELAAKRGEHLLQLAATAPLEYLTAPDEVRTIAAEGGVRRAAVAAHFAAEYAEALLAELERRELAAQQPAPAAPARPPARPGVIQPDPPDRSLDWTSPGGGGAAVVRPEPPEPEG